jgi:hypothetical protein
MVIREIEKARETNNVFLRSACENNMIAKAEQKRQEEEERKRKEEEERNRKKEEEREKAILVKEVVVKLAKAINAIAEKGGTCLYLEWHDGKEYDIENYTNITWYDFKNTFECTRSILESIGYKVNNLHLQSYGERRRSGVVGYISICW